MDPTETLRGAARTGSVFYAVPPLRGALGVDVTEQSTEPVSLERARLLLGWLKAQRAVDICLSELLAAGPAGERRVSREIDRVSGLVTAAAAAFESYRTCVRETQGGSADVPTLVPELRSISLDAAAPISQ
jgi:hypothetical protein